MKFNFFTFGGRFFWEDIFNYQQWKIQQHVRTQKYRLLDSHNIRRESGSFEQCKSTLLRYISACELPSIYNDNLIILHGYGRTSHTVRNLSESLKTLPCNVMVFNYASLRKDLQYHAKMLSQFLQNLNTKGNLYFITIGSGCLLVRKLLALTDNYRNYKIHRILDINPANSGSDLSDLLSKIKVCNWLLGPMLKDIATPQATKIPKLPHDIEHGIIFYPLTVQAIIKKLLKKFESFPPQNPPPEDTYAPIIKKFTKSRWFPLHSKDLYRVCYNFIATGAFDDKKRK